MVFSNQPNKDFRFLILEKEELIRLKLLLVAVSKCNLVNDYYTKVAEEILAVCDSVMEG